MISAEKISELVRHPHLAGNVTAHEILEVQQKFPYCSTLHLLYLKNLALSNDIQFEDRLRYAAAHVMDRERMYHLIHSDDTVVKPVVPVDSAKTEQEAVVLTHGTAVKGVIAETEGTDEKEKNVNAEKPVEIVHNPDDLIEETMLPSIATNVFEKELEIGAKENLTNQKPVETKIKTATPEPISETQPGTVDISKLSFVEWLRYKQDQKTGLSANPESSTEEKQSKTIEPLTEAEGDTFETPVDPGNKKRKTLSKTDVNEILNKFITEEPSISRPKTEFFNPVKNAKQSLEETPDLVTETLAKIYVLQKNYNKALQAYEQLILVYPEKKAFFASQIQKIKDELPK